ncbi:MAG TPA: methyltransferase domain-containing protein [Thermoanaerobaculia bacterium]|nr:methyltransferase domain-containing protein [Thermoanaerobaculia bacterium]
MKHVRAPLIGFDTVPAIEAALAGTKRPTKRFPVRYLRYWFVRNALAELQRELGRPLRVLEVGIGKGKMLGFMGGPSAGNGRYALPACIERWDALSAGADQETLERYSYSSFHQVDLNESFDLPAHDYDAIVVLHVLEHLLDPDLVLRRLLDGLAGGGLLVGGSPTMPSILARFEERRLRRKYAGRMHDLSAHKHLAVITPRRIRTVADREGISVEFVTGAFFLRASSNPLENHRWWLRANLAWGAFFPALGGEVYFALRKGSRRTTRQG